MKDYIAKNRDAWNKKTPIHIASDFYDNESFLKGRNTLNDIEMLLLGDVSGKSVLHLQCHFGQDSISLARMGAKVTAVDLSDEAIAAAKKMAEQTRTEVDFICCNIYDLPQYLDKKFDIVFTSYGTIGWLPDLSQWAKLIARYLKSDGKFVMAEFHPFLWIYDDDFRSIIYHYFNVEKIEEELSGTYGDREADIQYSTTTWNHPTGEVLNNLINAGIQIKSFNEYDYSPYNCFKHTIKVDDNKYRIEHFGNKIPMVFSILGTKEKSNTDIQNI